MGWGQSFMDLLMTCFCEQGNEYPGSVKDREFFAWLKGLLAFQG
jgi:hypothetical protein